jgi:hypothetical protein
MGGKNDVNTILGSTRAHFRTLQRKGQTVNNVCYNEMLFEPNAEDYCQKVLQCCMIMPIHTLLATLLKVCVTWALRCKSIIPGVLIWLLLTATCLVHSESLWEAAISQVTKEWKKCHSTETIFYFLRARRSLWTTRLNILKRTATR